MTEIIGWVSSLILFLTISRQIYKQWQERTSEGVSIWLFLGQIAASVGFAIYSWLVWNPVFIFTNVLMVLNGIVGFIINLYLKKREESEAKTFNQKEKVAEA
ncbi:MAG: SemiSWEET family transporter [Acidobacteriota bacterium]|nr:SemiSWEET family transporter [Acidobacteriota bacterium]